MNNFQIYSHSHSNKKNSVNSSLSTVKMQRKPFAHDDTINFNKFQHPTKTRFSYQENAKNLREVFSKQNKNINMNISPHLNLKTTPNHHITTQQDSLNVCFNHHNKQAKYIIIQKNQPNQTNSNPMYCCQRCAILIASKGFQIQKIKENTQNQIHNNKSQKMQLKINNNSKDSSFNKQKSKHLSLNEKNPQISRILNYSQHIKKELQQNWKKIKQNKEQCLQKIDSCNHYLDQKLNTLQDYFFTLHQYIERQKNNITKEIMKNKRSLQNLRVQTNNYYIDQLEDLKNIKQELQLKGFFDLIQYQNYMTSFKNNFIVIEPKELLLTINLRDIHDLGEEISSLIYKMHHLEQKVSENSQKQKKFNQKKEPVKNSDRGYGFSGQNSSIRSLQLSFEDQDQQKNQENNFTLNNYQLKERQCQYKQQQNNSFFQQYGSRNTSYNNNTNLLMTSTQF